MKKILMMLMLLVSTNVFAVDWVVAGGNDIFTHYVDPQSIKRDGNKVKAWVLYDFKSSQVGVGNKTSMSAVDRDEYDCFEDTVRSMDIYEYSGKMGTGDIVLSIPNLTQPAKSVIPGSTAATQLKLVCATK
jgi:hypothetical protein